MGGGSGTFFTIKVIKWPIKLIWPPINLTRMETYIHLDREGEKGWSITLLSRRRGEKRGEE